MDIKNPDMIPEAAKKAISCNGTHACRGKPEEMCPPESMVANNLLFVSNKKYPHCPYYVPFGYGGCCNFPVRKDIYKLYGI
ncbi:MAG: hypothetical protein Q8R38_08710 [Candidatus Omnitrophota bacterium]|nr:hypothetical protein [Candidatus Omnitrophota bacterium]